MIRTVQFIGCCLFVFSFSSGSTSVASPRVKGIADLCAGTGIVDVTPQPDVPLAGPIGGSGKATKVHDRLFARALAIRSGDERIVLCVVDVTMISSQIHSTLR